MLPSFKRVTCRIPIKNRIFDSNWRFHRIVKSSNTSRKFSGILSKSRIDDVSRKGISVSDKHSSALLSSAVAGKCTVDNADVSIPSRPQTATTIFSLVISKSAVCYSKIRISLTDSTSQTSSSCCILNSFIINKSAIFQDNFIWQITKQKGCASFSRSDIAIKNAVADSNSSGNRARGCIGTRSISAIDVNCPANAFICLVTGEFRVVDRHAAQQVINSSAVAAFVVGKFAICDSQNTPTFGGDRTATAFGIIC
ncbi:hypothetical protein E5S67_06405 [Microcoleus sp. IPMA8]|uniref:Uncharacterized protein n=1 Tax=Microcoleus asticus IPMA8 TaxID=2563858 RepID=A0ABX2D7H3_9CYAN|nr:hypothetical protein [Microcoleus asticus IPMA8]